MADDQTHIFKVSFEVDIRCADRMAGATAFIADYFAQALGDDQAFFSKCGAEFGIREFNPRNVQVLHMMSDEGVRR